MDYWNHVLWSDETKINLFGSEGVKRVWRHPGEEYKDKCLGKTPTVKHGVGSVMVWGCMSAAGTGELQFIEGTMNANMYCDILKQSMIPSLWRLGRRAVFQHDNDPKHTSKMTTALLKKLSVKVICEPSSNGRWRSARSLTSTSFVMSSWRSGRRIQWQPMKLWWTPCPRGLRQCWKIMVATQNIDTLGPIWTFSLRGVLFFVASGLDSNGCVLSYFEGTANLHCGAGVFKSLYFWRNTVFRKCLMSFSFHLACNMSDKAAFVSSVYSRYRVQTSNVNNISPAFNRLLLAESEFAFFYKSV